MTRNRVKAPQGGKKSVIFVVVGMTLYHQACMHTHARTLCSFAIVQAGPHGPRFSLRTVQVGFMVSGVALRQVYLLELWPSPVSIVPPAPRTHSTVIHRASYQKQCDGAIREYSMEAQAPHCDVM